MKHSYTLAGMTCVNCMATIKRRLSAHSGVVSVELELNPQRAVVEMNQHINTADLQKTLGDGKYKIFDELTISHCNTYYLTAVLTSNRQ